MGDAKEASWHELFRAAVERRIQNTNNPINPNSLKQKIVQALKGIDSTISQEIYEEWLDGKSFPRIHAMHAQLLIVLSEHGSSDDNQLKELRDARLKAFKPPHLKKAAKKSKLIPIDLSSNSSASNFADEIRNDYDKIYHPELYKLRFDRSSTPYKNLESTDREKIIRETESAAEHLHCCRLRRYPILNDAATAIGVSNTALRNWEIGKTLPEHESLNLLRKLYPDNEEYERYRELVSINNNIIMMKTIQRSKGQAFGTKINRISTREALEALKSFLDNNDNPLDTPIISKGIYLLMLRQAMNVNLITVLDGTEFKRSFIMCIEGDSLSNKDKANAEEVRKRYKAYLEGKLAERVEHPPGESDERERELASEVLKLLSTPAAQKKISQLPTVRPNRLQQGPAMG